VTRRGSPTPEPASAGFAVDDALCAAVLDGQRPWATPERRRHPQRYLEYLCTPADDPLVERSMERRYRETKHGRRALESLDWQQVLRHPRRAMLARSVVEDIAARLGVPNPVPGIASPLTAPRNEARVLRNL